MIKVTGYLHFEPQPKTKKHKKQSKWKKQAMIRIGGDMDLFYSKFIEKEYNLHLIRPHRLSHMTFVADKDVDSNKWKKVKEKYNGKKVTLTYSPDVRANENYWWLKAKCSVADEIRKELELGEPFFPYHITIGNVKDSEIEHNKYILRCREYFG